MARSVYKICACRDQVKCRHPWWFSFKRPGEPRLRKSLDVVLETHIDSKTVAEREAEGLRRAIVDNTVPARTRELLGLPAVAMPMLQVLTMRQLLDSYQERHLVRTATADKQAYQIAAVCRTRLPRMDGTTVAFGDWLVSDVTADTLERLRERRSVPGVLKRPGGSNHSGGPVAANRDLQLLRAAFNWAIDRTLLERTPFKRGEKTTVKLTRELARSRRLQPGEQDRLLPTCGDHLRALVEAALESGCREGELLSLQWQQVQRVPKPELWLPAGKTKSGKARRVPLSTRLQMVLEMRQDALRATLEKKSGEPLPGTLYVFGNELGQRIRGIKTAWLGACQRATIDDLRFHDLRREAGSRWMESGVPLATIQKWLGHANISQTSRYLATTTVGEHEAMRRFEERIGRVIPESIRLEAGGTAKAGSRLTPIDTAGGSGGRKSSRFDTTTSTKTGNSSIKH